MEDFNEVDIEVPENNDLFRVREAIRSIESSKVPDLQKLRVLFGESKKVFSSIETPKDMKIKAFKWNNTGYINKDMSEEELIREIDGSQERFHKDVAFRNAIRLVVFYKRLWKNSKFYEPFFQYCLELITRILSTPNIETLEVEKKRSETLFVEVQKLEVENGSLKSEVEILLKNFSEMKEELKNLFIKPELFMLMNRLYDEHSGDSDLAQAILLVQMRGGSCTLRDFKKEYDWSPERVRGIVTEKYPKYFLMSAGGVQLNFESVKEKAEKNVNDKLKGLDEVTKKEGFFTQKFKKISEAIQSLKKES